MIYLQIASLVSFVVCAFSLYFLLVRNMEMQVATLKDELDYRSNYKGKLETIRVFYEEETKMLQEKL